jgi:hypothetical protein
MAAIKLKKDELDKIMQTLEKFPDVDDVTIATNPNGVGVSGYTVDVVVDVHYNGVAGIFKFDLSDA